MAITNNKSAGDSVCSASSVPDCHFSIETARNIKRESCVNFQHVKCSQQLANVLQNVGPWIHYSTSSSTRWQTNVRTKKELITAVGYHKKDSK